MSAKQVLYVSGGILLLILVVCFITLLLPTSVKIVPDNAMRGETIIITVGTLLHKHTFILPPGAPDLISIKAGSFSVNAIVQYPKYFIGVLAVMALAGTGLYFNSVSIKGLEEE